MYNNLKNAFSNMGDEMMFAEKYRKYQQEMTIEMTDIINNSHCR